MRTRLFVAVAFLAASPLLAATTFRQVDVRIVPPQPVAAISIRAGDETRSVTVRSGKALIPADLPPPWSLQLLRFEADVYTQADLDAKRPWVIRELGIVRGELERRSPAKEERYTWLLAETRSEEVREADFTPDGQGAFEIRLPAGNYHGVVLGPGRGTRIRSGIVVKPGETTDLGVIVPEPAAPVSVRVLDTGGRGGVAGARVVWDPPGEILNSRLSRRLYARRWSAVTDRAGMAQIPAVGPVPHSARWRIEANGFTATRTAGVLLKEPGRFAMPDVRLRPEPSVVVRVHFPREKVRELERAQLVSAENRDPHSRRFEPVSRVPLREGESAFRFTSYGLKRVWVESAAGKQLVFQTFEVKEPSSVVDFVLRQVEISGRVTHRDRPLEGALVSLADPLNGSQFLAQVPSEHDGSFRFLTWATGKMFLYTSGPGGRPDGGKSFGNARAYLELAGRSEVSVDLEVPKSGFSLSIVDKDTGAPVRAKLDFRARFPGEQFVMGWKETDAQGRFDLTGYADGTATLNVVAKGYRAQTVEIAIREDLPDATVRLERAKPSSLRVVDPRGVPIPDALVTGGYENEYDFQPFYDTSTDAAGRVEFDAPPPTGTVFYIAAGGHALGMTTLAPERETTVTLHPPSSSIITLRQDNKPPDKVFLVMAAPAGGAFIPVSALGNLCDANGMSLFQLAGSSATGDVVLPEFLPPGTYDLFLARRPAPPLYEPYTYQKVGTVRTPLTRSTILAVNAP